MNGKWINQHRGLAKTDCVGLIKYFLYQNDSFVKDKRVMVDLIYLDFFTTLALVPHGKFSLKMVVSA